MERIHCLILTSSVIKSEKVSICRYTQYSVRICKISTNSFQSVESGVKVVLTRRQNDPCSCHWGLWFPRIACCLAAVGVWSTIHRSRNSQKFSERTEAQTIEGTVPRKFETTAGIGGSRSQSKRILDWVSISEFLSSWSSDLLDRMEVDQTEVGVPNHKIRHHCSWQVKIRDSSLL